MCFDIFSRYVGIEIFLDFRLMELALTNKCGDTNLQIE